jgi:hypothetical protein
VKKSIIGAAALSLAIASPAYATVFDFNVYDAGFTGTLGTVTVGGEGTSTLSFDVALNSDVFFQMTGNGSARDVFWFDLNKTLVGGGLSSFTGAVTANILTPTGGGFPTGGQFAVARDLNSFGQGWSASYDYGATGADSSAGGNLNYYTGHLAFDLAATDGSLLSLASGTHNGATVYGGADLRQCAVSGGCTTGPVGFSLSARNPNPTGAAVPEPATWAMMIVGFGAIGASMRRKQRQTVNYAFA